MLGRFRATGADLPFADPRRSHGVAMEGYFWRMTDARAGRVVIALCGVNRDGDGRHWAIAGLASHPGGFVRHAVVPAGGAAARGIGVWAGDGAFRADARELHVDLGADARLDVRLDDLVGWGRRRAYGGLGLGHAVPLLGQYWHPHGLGGTATGVAVLGGERVELAGARVYAEKNWSHRGFPRSWWWGQAHCFAADDGASVAFAGGDIRLAGRDLTATAVVVRAGGRVVRFGNPVSAPVAARVSDDRWSLVGRGPRYAVEIEGEAHPADAHVLPVPLPSERRAVPGSLQHLGGRMHVTLRRHGRLLFAGESPLAGMEHGGRDRVQEELARRAPEALAV